MVFHVIMLAAFPSYSAFSPCPVAKIALYVGQSYQMLVVYLTEQVKMLSYDNTVHEWLFHDGHASVPVSWRSRSAASFVYWSWRPSIDGALRLRACND